MSTIYRGRFAPTPSGPLHFGSLVAATGSYLEARKHGGQWFLRIDDIDSPRVQPGAVDWILQCMERYGFAWDGPVIYQSQRLPAYHAALHRLNQLGLVYPCSCSRSDIARVATVGVDGPVYPGSCRDRLQHKARALRLNLAGATIAWNDAIQGVQCADLTRDMGDFVLYRADSVYAFHLASAVDDADLGVTHVVRGADLLESSMRQSHIQRLLGVRIPHYAHLPVAVDLAGEKLSKQTGAEPLSLENPPRQMVQVLAFLGQRPPANLQDASTREVWDWSLHHWNIDAVPRVRQRSVDSVSLAKRAISSGNANAG